MAELLNHQHCRVCDRATSFGEITCAEHKEEYEKVQKKRKRTVLLFYLGSAVLVIVLARQLMSGF